MEREEILALAKKHQKSLEQNVINNVRDEYEKKAMNRIYLLLAEIIKECDNGALKLKQERYPYISRLVVEADPSLLDPNLGGELIALEKAYQSLV